MNTLIYTSSDLTLTFTDASIQTESGTTTSWLPVVTPWPAFVSCSTEAYAGPDHNAILFDPYYQTSVVPGANSPSCLPPQATAWWNQGADNVVLLGPTFFCPSAYSAVKTLSVNPATQQTLCCPSNFGLHIPMTQLTKGAFPSQCTSMMSSGESYVYMTSTSESWGLYTDEIIDSYTVYAVPVNGFNIQSTATTSPSTTSAINLVASTIVTGINLAQVSATGSVTASNAQYASSSLSELSSDATSLDSPSLDVAIGIGIGIGIGLILLIGACVPIYKLWERRRQNTHGEIYTNNQELSPQYENQFHVYQEQSDEIHPPPTLYPEIDGANRKSVDRRTQVFEMSDKRQTDSWVKKMMEANQEELWMESPIR